MNIRVLSPFHRPSTASQSAKRPNLEPETFTRTEPTAFAPRLSFRPCLKSKSAPKRAQKCCSIEGAWQENVRHEIDVAVPLSPSDFLRKKKAIFMHESQKDVALFPGADPREF